MQVSASTLVVSTNTQTIIAFTTPPLSLFAGCKTLTPRPLPTKLGSISPPPTKAGIGKERHTDGGVMFLLVWVVWKAGWGDVAIFW